MHNDLPIIDFIGGAQRKIISKCVVWVYVHMLVLNIRLLMARVWLRRVIKLIITTCSLELQTEVCEDIAITEKASIRAFFLLKGPTSAFTFKTLLRHYAKRAPKHGK